MSKKYTSSGRLSRTSLYGNWHGKRDEYRCALCGKVYEKGWTDEEEAMQETNTYWPDTTREECDVVCDDCWQKIKPGGAVDGQFSDAEQQMKEDDE